MWIVLYLIVGIVLTTITCTDRFINFIVRNVPSNGLIEYYEKVRDDYRYRFNYIIAWSLMSPVNLFAMSVVAFLWSVCYIFNGFVKFVFGVKD